MNKRGVYIKSILLPIIVGGVVGLIISKFMNYDYLQKPVLAPPAIVFPIIWTILYFLMGVSYGILKANHLTDASINTIYFLQLFVNALWPIFFFLLDWRLFSFLWLLLLYFLVVIMLIQFYEKNKIAGLLQIPYVLWLLVASYLNLSIYLLNR